jgi:hypothetical protein
MQMISPGGRLGHLRRNLRASYGSVNRKAAVAYTKESAPDVTTRRTISCFKSMIRFSFPGR